ncbi:MAG: hypothetical protein KatS3mg076_0848 [Candidatus Binatia bacterium]|nr:MAG: hypothetical protein KatS3mg076_0848 [Candidatus Binatia bacterium]
MQNCRTGAFFPDRWGLEVQGSVYHELSNFDHVLVSSEARYSVGKRTELALGYLYSPRRLLFEEEEAARRVFYAEHEMEATLRRKFGERKRLRARVFFPRRVGRLPNGREPAGLVRSRSGTGTSVPLRARLAVASCLDSEGELRVRAPRGRAGEFRSPELRRGGGLRSRVRARPPLFFFATSDRCGITSWTPCAPKGGVTATSAARTTSSSSSSGSSLPSSRFGVFPLLCGIDSGRGFWTSRANVIRRENSAYVGSSRATRWE